MDKREALRSMLNNLINDKPEEATLDLHGYLSVKMKEVAGLAAAPQEGEVDPVSTEDDPTDPE
jgi:hypothetical protein